MNDNVVTLLSSLCIVVEQTAHVLNLLNMQ